MTKTLFHYFNNSRAAVLQLYLLVIIIGYFIIFPSVLFGQSATTYNSGSGNFVVPAGVTCIKVQAWGGGGGGGNGTGYAKGAGGGGAYASSFLTVSPGTSLPYSVGNGGAKAASGSASNFNTGAVVAAGGALANVTGGAGGTVAASTGTIRQAGGKGGNGYSTTVAGGGGGGGGSATSSAAGGNGGNGTTTNGGAAGIGQGTGGASGDLSGSTSPTAGVAPGGGGGGGGNPAGSISQAGANGRIIVSWIDVSNISTSVAAVSCSGYAAAVTLTSSTLSSDSYIVSYNLTGATIASSTATIAFSGGAASFNTSVLSNAGSTTVTVTSISFVGPSCATTVSAGNTAATNVSTPASAAGTNIVTCSGSGAVNITAGSSATYATGLAWSTNGTGTFANNNSADALANTTYTPSAADISAGSRTLTLTATSGTCTATSNKTITIGASILQFTSQPAATSTTTVQDAATIITVSSYCAATSSIDVTYNGNITLTIFKGCGYTAQTVAAINGTATFSVLFNRSPQTNVQLRATATGYTAVNSNLFNIGAPSGTPTNVVIASENFEEWPASPTWPYTVGSPIYTLTGPGTDWTTVKKINNNYSLVKSYTTENGVGMRKSKTTATFATQSGLAAYSSLRLVFKVGSLYDALATPRSPALPAPPSIEASGGIASGSGMDPAEDMNVDICIDGTWYPVLTYLVGTDNFLFNFSAANTNLAYNANAIYTPPSAKSAFTVFIPNGTSSVALRMTAINNRPSENWAIDSIYLTGTIIVPGQPKNLPAAAGAALLTCPSSLNNLSAYVADTYGTVSYSWAPTTYIAAGANTASPTVQLPLGAAVPYTVTGTFTDADGCSDTAQVQLSFPGGATGTWYGYYNRDWFQCQNWGGGNIPNSATRVTIGAVSNFAEINPASPFAPAGGTAYAWRINLSDSLWMQPNAILTVTDSISISTVSGVQYGSIDMSASGGHTSPNTINLGGNWINKKGTAGYVANKGKIILNGSGAQYIYTASGNETIYDLATNKAAGSTALLSDVLVTDSLTLLGGIINTKINSPDAAAIALGVLTMDTAAKVGGTPSTISYVNGQMAKRTNAANAAEFDFPIGKTDMPYKPVSVLPVTHAAITTYTAEFFNRNPGSDYPQPFLGTALPIALLSDKYWQVSKTANAATGRIGIDYAATVSPAGWVLWLGTSFAPTPIPSAANVAVAHNDGSTWHFTKASGNFNSVGPLYETIYYGSSGKIYSDAMGSFSPFTVAFSDNTVLSLPVQLLAFEGRLAGTDGSLNWKVANQSGLSGFVLEHSSDGLHFKQMAQILSSGESTYSYLHRPLSAGKHCYRLVVKEKNGNTFYSRIVTLGAVKNPTEILSLTPTIVQIKFQINIHSASSQLVQASITDAAGRQVVFEKGKLTAGDNQWQIPASSLAKGMYYVMTNTADGQKRTLQFVKE